MKYISENYLLAKLHANGCITRSDIDNVRAEDYHEVKTGCWVEHKYSSGPSLYYCSECNTRLTSTQVPKRAKYCHCGAKMIGVVQQ